MPLNFTILRQDALDTIGAVQNITGKKSALAILSNVLMETGEDSLVITATDLETATRLTVPATVREQGRLTLPARKLFELLRESSSPSIDFEEQDNCWVKITSGSSVYNLAGVPADDFPALPDHDREAVVEIGGSVFVELIEKTEYCIAQEKENIYTLTAARLILEDAPKEAEQGGKVFRFVTSDGHRLSLMSVPVDAEVEKLHWNEVTLIPRRGIREIKRFCEAREQVNFGLEEKQAIFFDDEALLIIRLMDGQFPDHGPILDAVSTDMVIRISRPALLDSLKRISLFTDDVFHSIRLDISPGRFVFTSSNADYGRARDEMEIDYDGEPMTLGFNCRYFIEALQVMSGDTVNMFITGDDTPCMLTCDDDPGFLSIIMPMKLGAE